MPNKRLTFGWSIWMHESSLRNQRSGTVLTLDLCYVMICIGSHRGNDVSALRLSLKKLRTAFLLYPLLDRTRKSARPGHLHCHQDTANHHTLKWSDCRPPGSRCATLWAARSGSAKPHSPIHSKEWCLYLDMLLREGIIKSEATKVLIVCLFQISLLPLKR